MRPRTIRKTNIAVERRAIANIGRLLESAYHGITPDDLDNKMNEVKMELKIFKIVDDEWELIETIEAETGQECIEIAESKYNQDEFHWTNPF